MRTVAIEEPDDAVGDEGPFVSPSQPSAARPATNAMTLAYMVPAYRESWDTFDRMLELYTRPTVERKRAAPETLECAT